MKISQKGFSVVEAVVVLVVVGLIGGVGYVAYHRHQTKNNTASTSSTSTQSKVTAPAGTTANIGQITQQDMNDTASIDSKYTNAYQSTAQSTNQAAANVGGAYNEQNF